MNDKAFVDTNVLVYTHDLDAGEKHAIAIGIISDPQLALKMRRKF